jgi:hypothetical protein
MQYIIPEIAIYFVGQFYCMVFSSLALQQLILSLIYLSFFSVTVLFVLFLLSLWYLNTLPFLEKNGREIR